jgi:hypothetical protein
MAAAVEKVELVPEITVAVGEQEVQKRQASGDGEDGRAGERWLRRAVHHSL